MWRLELFQRFLFFVHADLKMPHLMGTGWSAVFFHSYILFTLSLCKYASLTSGFIFFSLILMRKKEFHQLEKKLEWVILSGSRLV